MNHCMGVQLVVCRLLDSPLLSVFIVCTLSHEEPATAQLWTHFTFNGCLVGRRGFRSTFWVKTSSMLHVSLNAKGCFTHCFIRRRNHVVTCITNLQARACLHHGQLLTHDPILLS